MISNGSSPRSSQGKPLTRSSTSTLDPHAEPEDDLDWIVPQHLPQIENVSNTRQFDRDEIFGKDFENFCSTFWLDMRYGTCRDYRQLEALPACFRWIEDLIVQPQIWRRKASLVAFLQDKTLPGELPELTNSQALKLVTATFHLVNVYCFCKEEKGAPAQKIPAILAVPHVHGCKTLRLGKISLGYAHLWACWELRDPQQNIYDIENFKMLISFTDDDGDRVFNGLSNVLAFCLQKVNSLLFKISSDIWKGKYQDIADNFATASQVLFRFVPQMKKMFESLSREFFLGEYRNYLRGFDSKEDFPDGVEFEGTGVRTNTVGGSAGNDPSVQIFERFMGIKYSGIHDTLQTLLKQGFMGQHADCITFLENNNIIRDFLSFDKHADPEMIEGYNELLLAFAAVFRKHYTYIYTYLVDRKPSALHPSQVFGTGGIRAVELGQKASLIEGFSINVSLQDPRGASWQSQKTIATPVWDKIPEVQNPQLLLPKAPTVKPKGCPFGFS